MKKLMTIMLGLSLLGGTVALFAQQEPPKAEKTAKKEKKAKKAPKKAKKTEEKK